MQHQSIGATGQEERRHRQPHWSCMVPWPDERPDEGTLSASCALDARCCREQSVQPPAKGARAVSQTKAGGLWFEKGVFRTDGEVVVG
jgi:hypothetical protein